MNGIKERRKFGSEVLCSLRCPYLVESVPGQTGFCEFYDRAVVWPDKGIRPRRCEECRQE